MSQCFPWLKYIHHTLLSCKISWVQSYASINILLLVVYLIQSKNCPYRRMVYGGWQIDGGKQANFLKKLLTEQVQQLSKALSNYCVLDSNLLHIIKFMYHIG